MELISSKDLKPKHKTVLLYCPPGIGKTTTLGLLKGKTLIIDVDKGTSVLAGMKGDFKVTPIKKDLANLKSIIEELEQNCPYDNVCLDSLSELEKSMLTAYGRDGRNDGAPELRHYNQAGFKISDICRRLRDLSANIIFTAWETLGEIVMRDGSKFTQSKPQLSGKTSDAIMGICDIVGHVEISDKEETKGQRFIRLDATPTCLAKDRIDKRVYCKVEDLL